MSYFLHKQSPLNKLICRNVKLYFLELNVVYLCHLNIAPERYAEHPVENFSHLSTRQTYNMTCMTSKDSNQPVHPHSMTRVLVHLSLDSLEAVEGTCHQQRLVRLCGCAGWPESLLVAQLIVGLSCAGSLLNQGTSNEYPQHMFL